VVSTIEKFRDEYLAYFQGAGSGKADSGAAS
jgi:hypothetical protein